MFSNSNSKLGSIWHFSIPAGDTCPGRSAACDSCYALRHWFASTAVRGAYDKNLDITKENHFVSRAISEIARLHIRVLRVHSSGDLYDVGYARKWVRIMRARPSTRFFLYTRSWRLPKFDSVLAAMASLPNVRLWYSIDRDTGNQRTVPPGVRLAYLQLEHDDMPPSGTDLVFRDHKLRRRMAKKVDGVVVCPPENGTGVEMGCQQCGICWRDRGERFSESRDPKTRRLSLQLLSS